MNKFKFYLCRTKGWQRDVEENNGDITQHSEG